MISHGPGVWCGPYYIKQDEKLVSLSKKFNFRYKNDIDKAPFILCQNDSISSETKTFKEMFGTDYKQ